MPRGALSWSLPCLPRCDVSSLSWLHVGQRGTEGTPININDYSGVGEGGGLNTISLPFVNAAQFITAIFVLEKRFKVFGQDCPYTELTGEHVNIRKHQDKGLGKYKLQRQAHRPSNLVLIKPKRIKMRWRVSPSSGRPVPVSRCLCRGLAAPHAQPLFLQSCLEMV